MKPLSWLRTSFLLLPRLKAKIVRIGLLGVFLFSTKRLPIAGVVLGVLLQASSPGVLVAATAAKTSPVINTVGISEPGGSAQANVPLSIPRFFRKGEIANYAQPTVNGNPAETWQCDVKNCWDDGSLKFAVVSLITPLISGKHTDAIGFANNLNRDSGLQSGIATGYLKKTEMLDSAYDFEATIVLTGAVSHTISARAMLQAGTFRYWLQGPVVTAVIVEDRDGRSFDVNTDGAQGSPLHPIFEAWFYPQTHKVEVGFTIENSWASSVAVNSARNQG